MRPTTGMMMSLTSESTILPNAAPMMTPTARSTTLPLAANSLNSVASPMLVLLASWPSIAAASDEVKPEDEHAPGPVSSRLDSIR